MGPQLPLNLLLAFLLLAAWGVTFACVRGRARRASEPSSSVQSRERRSLGTIGPFLVGAFVLPFLLFFLGIGPVLPLWVQLVGGAVLVAGIVFHAWALTVLGRFFSPNVVIRSDHRLIREGPYRALRHPVYTGMFMIALGTSLLVGPVLGVALTVLLAMAGFLYRIRIEEKLMTEKFGNEYEAYRQESWKMFPGLF